MDSPIAEHVDSLYEMVPLPSYVSEEGPWIRLLRIGPGDSEDDVQCDLITRALYDTPLYSALSYSWGKQPPTERLRMKRKAYASFSSPELLVSPHLKQALQYLKRLDRVVYVWVDAICINQGDDAERGSQVRIMAQIYAQADEVLVWLGESDALVPDDLQENWKVMCRLCRQADPWWTRLWVLQECTYSSACPVIILGSQRMIMPEFLRIWKQTESECRAVRPWYVMDDMLEKVSQSRALIEALYQSWASQNKQGWHKTPLLSLLRQTATRTCSDFHDRVYALLNLIPEAEADLITPDYNQNYRAWQQRSLEVLVRFHFTLPELQTAISSLLRCSSTWAKPLPATLRVPQEPSQGSWISTILRELFPHEDSTCGANALNGYGRLAHIELGEDDYSYTTVDLSGMRSDEIRLVLGVFSNGDEGRTQNLSAKLGQIPTSIVRSILPDAKDFGELVKARHEQYQKIWPSQPHFASVQELVSALFIDDPQNPNMMSYRSAASPCDPSTMVMCITRAGLAAFSFPGQDGRHPNRGDTIVFEDQGSFAYILGKGSRIVTGLCRVPYGLPSQRADRCAINEGLSTMLLSSGCRIASHPLRIIFA